MELRLQLESNVVVERRGPGYHASLAPDSTLEVGPLILRPESIAAWAREVIEDTLGPTTTTRAITEGNATTEHGWQLRWIDVQDGDRRSIFAFFVFLEHTACLVVHGAAGDAQLRHRFLDVVRSARPDFSSERVPALCLLWA
jgi:hypothetical protein